MKGNTPPGPCWKALLASMSSWWPLMFLKKRSFAKKVVIYCWKCNLCSKCQKIIGICCRGCTSINPIELHLLWKFLYMMEPTLHGWCALFWIFNPSFQGTSFPTIPMKRISFLTFFAKVSFFPNGWPSVALSVFCKKTNRWSKNESLKKTDCWKDG